MRSFILMFFLTIAPPLISTASGQVATDTAKIDVRKAALTRTLLETMQAGRNVLTAIEASVPVQRAANPEIPGEFWDEFLKRARAQVGDLIESLIPIYANRFSEVELKQLTDFYLTPLGQRLLEELPSITQESMQTGQQWGARLGAAVSDDLLRRGVIVKE